MIRIVFLDRATFPADVTFRPPAAAHQWLDVDHTEPADVRERAAGAQVIVTNKAKVRRETIEQLPDLKLVAVTATGTDNVDVADCRARGIVVQNVSGYAVRTVPEHIFALILALRRSLIAYHQDVVAGRWQRSRDFCFLDYPIGEIAGSTIGIIGGGAIGTSVARIAEGFGMRVLIAARKGVDPEAGRVAFEQVLAEADILSLSVPLTDETRNLIALPEFRAMGRRPLLINAARGGVVNEADLVAALDAGLIAGAGVDVSASEPPQADSPLMTLAGRPNVIITPHVAWASREAMQVIADRVVDAIDTMFPANTPD